MDSRSHVEFAKRLLPDHLQSAVPAALFPQIDRQPATLHRNFAHHIAKAEHLSNLGMRVLADSSVVEGSEDYASKRFLEEKERIKAYVPGYAAPRELTTEIREAASLAFISHLYLDTFNQPVQAFTPFKSSVSGQFALWDRIGDFRYRLYVDGVVEELRKDWLKSAIWNSQFDVHELSQAMVLRLADLASLDRKSDLVTRALSALRLTQDTPVARAVEWCKEMESELSDLHIRYLG